LPKREERKNYASSKKLLTSVKEKGPLGKKSPFTRKEKGTICQFRAVKARRACKLGSYYLE